MISALPLITRRQIAREYRPDGGVSEAAVIRSLRGQRALSPGLSATGRDAGGHLRGRLHLYSALNRDAARALRRGEKALARKFRTAAMESEGSPEAARVIAALAGSLSDATLSALARALSSPALIKDLSVLVNQCRRVRNSLGNSAPFIAGRVRSAGRRTAVIELGEQQASVPRDLLEDAGISVGQALCATWEVLAGGRSLLTLEPGVETPRLTRSGEPLVDMYGTPWGTLLSGLALQMPELRGRPVHLGADLPVVR